MYSVNRFKRFLLLLILLLSVAVIADEPEVNRWEAAIQAFETMDKENPPKQGAVLFVGSSSIRMWKTLKTDFPNIDVINRGFGGSGVEDLVYFANRIVIPYHPRLVVVYSGVNDIARGKSPENVLQDFRTIVQAVHNSLPETPFTTYPLAPD